MTEFVGDEYRPEDASPAHSLFVVVYSRDEFDTPRCAATSDHVAALAAMYNHGAAGAATTPAGILGLFGISCPYPPEGKIVCSICQRACTHPYPHGKWLEAGGSNYAATSFGIEEASLYTLLDHHHSAVNSSFIVAAGAAHTLHIRCHGANVIPLSSYK
ncbi:hypothetical protein [Methanogenium cariaci]